MNRTLLLGYGLAFLILCIPVAAKLLWDVPPEYMLRDAAAVTDTPAYIGIVSNLGLLLWAATAGICLFAAASQPHVRRFWLYAGLLTMALLADDWLLLHENGFPVYLGIPEKLVYALYGLATLGYVVRFRRLLLRAEYLVLLVAFGWFAASVGADAFLDGVVWVPGFFLWEDGAKLFGIVTWLVFHGRFAHALATDPALQAVTDGGGRGRAEGTKRLSSVRPAGVIQSSRPAGG